MMRKEKLREISEHLVTNDVDFMCSFRENLFKYVEDKEITINDISVESGIPFNTLNSCLYGKSHDMKVSNVIKLAKALEVSVDELTGAGTIPELTKESIVMCRNLPENDLYLVRWFIRYLYTLNQNLAPHKRFISVMKLTLENNHIKITSDYKKVDISELDKSFSSKIFFGITLPCDYYMPKYSPYDILFIANDRYPTIFDDSLIRVGNYLYLATRKVENKVVKYYSIRDGKYRLDESDIDELIGYVAFKKSFEKI